MTTVRDGVHRRALLTATVVTAAAAVVRGRRRSHVPPPHRRRWPTPRSLRASLSPSSAATTSCSSASIGRLCTTGSTVRPAAGWDRSFTPTMRPSLRAAVLFGHGDRFSRGIDVDAAQASFQSGQPASVRPAR
jgi:hypothetical protein